MLRPPNDLILQTFSQVIEIIAISGHSNNQIAVSFGIFLSFAKCFRIYDIKLDMVSVHSEVSANQLA